MYKLQKKKKIIKGGQDVIAQKAKKCYISQNWPLIFCPLDLVWIFNYFLAVIPLAFRI